jgi:hypothetical protein
MGIIRSVPPPCSECRALGAFEHDSLRYDLYFCLVRLHSLPVVDPDWPTFLARHGPGRGDFIAGIASAGQHPALHEAKQRAVEEGLHDHRKALHPGMHRFAVALADLLMKDVER